MRLRSARCLDRVCVWECACGERGCGEHGRLGRSSLSANLHGMGVWAFVRRAFCVECSDRDHGATCAPTRLSFRASNFPDPR